MVQKQGGCKRGTSCVSNLTQACPHAAARMRWVEGWLRDVHAYTSCARARAFAHVLTQARACTRTHRSTQMHTNAGKHAPLTPLPPFLRTHTTHTCLKVFSDLGLLLGGQTNRGRRGRAGKSETKAKRECAIETMEKEERKQENNARHEDTGSDGGGGVWAGPLGPMGGQAKTV